LEKEGEKVSCPKSRRRKKKRKRKRKEKITIHHQALRRKN
jgi:hypothetical protein